jgi:hypothetical protein
MQIPILRCSLLFLLILGYSHLLFSQDQHPRSDPQTSGSFLPNMLRKMAELILSAGAEARRS